jgi:serine/threonine protein kinase
VLDGSAAGWAELESRAGTADPALLEQLRVLAAVRAVARSTEGSQDAAPQFWGHLRVLERIGHGAFGEVYRAWDTRLDREVALKLLPPEHAPSNNPPPSIIEEGRLLARVRHPNVVTIYGAERIDGRVGLWMEFVRGHTLERTLQTAQSSVRTTSFGSALNSAVRCQRSTPPGSCTATSSQTTSWWPTMDGWC